MSTDKKTIQWYDEHAQEYAKHVLDPKDSIYHAYYEKPAMYALLPNITGKTVLSLGCGSGEDSSYLKKQGAAESVGIDISREMVAIAAERHPECRFKVMDMERLDFADGAFDFAYSSLAIHYIEDWTVAFKEIFRVLKPGARFLFSCGHPVRSAMAVTEDNEKTMVRQLAIINDRATKDVEVVGDYLHRRKLDEGLGRVGTVTTWHKSISEIITEAAAAGFVVERFVEPKPLESMKDVSARDYKRLQKVPEFMIFGLWKPIA